MRPNRIETIQTIQEGPPTLAPMEPIENSTSAGTPLAIQKAPVQLIRRCKPLSAAGAAIAGTFSATAIHHPPRAARAFLTIKKVVNDKGGEARISIAMIEQAQRRTRAGASAIRPARFFDATNLFQQENWCIQEKQP